MPLFYLFVFFLREEEEEEERQLFIFPIVKRGPIPRLQNYKIFKTA
jgi:hypothetical protein